MPKINKIVSFADTLLSLGEEKQYLQEQGENVQKIPVPAVSSEDIVFDEEQSQETNLEGKSAQSFIEEFEKRQEKTTQKSTPSASLGSGALSSLAARYELDEPSESEAISPEEGEILGTISPEQGAPAESSLTEESPPAEEVEPSIAEGTAEELSSPEDELSSLLSGLGEESPPIEESPPAEEVEPSTAEETAEELSSPEDELSSLLSGLGEESPPIEESPPAEEVEPSTAEGTAEELSSPEDDLSSLLSGLGEESPPIEESPPAEEVEPSTAEGTAETSPPTEDAKTPVAGDEEVEQLSSFIQSMDFDIDTPESTAAGTPERTDSETPETVPSPAGKINKETGEREFTQEEFDAITQQLERLPFDLRKATASFIANPASSKNEVINIIELLIRKNPVHTIARFVNRYTGADIIVPYGFQRESVQELRKREESRLERLKRKYLPVAMTVLASVIGVSLIGFALSTLVYRPIASNIQYRRGYMGAEEKDYDQSESFFLEGWRIWESPSWVYRYADLFIEQQDYTRAVQKYDQLVYGTDPDLRQFLIEKTNEGVLSDLYEFNDERVSLISLIELDREGIFRHIDLQSTILGGYQRADDLSTLLLEVDKFDREALIARGDNYMRWARFVDMSRYEDARNTYATLLTEYGQADDIVQRMLWYFVRTDNFSRAMDLVRYLDDKNKIEIIPDMYTEVAGYLISNYELEYASNILDRVAEMAPGLPEMYYQWSRYYRRIGNPIEEKRFLEASIVGLERAGPLRFDRLAMMVDSHARLGEYFLGREHYLDANNALQEALTHLEIGLDTRSLELTPELARVYELLGDVRYFGSKDFTEAGQYYALAREGGVESPELFYKSGYVAYHTKDYARALPFFLEAESFDAENAATLLAIGNSLYYEQQYAAAEGYLSSLLDVLHARRDTIQNFLPFEFPEHQHLVNLLIRSSNNLGLVLYQSSQRSSDSDTFARSLLLLEQSITYSENFLRDQESFARSDAKSLAYVNLRQILYPVSNFPLQIYQEVPLEWPQP